MVTLLTVLASVPGSADWLEAQIGPASDAAAMCVATGQTRWVPGDSGRYRRTHVYGREEGTWIGALGGVRRGEAGIGLFDHQAGRIHVVDDSLRPRARFGRIGEGPGEMQASMIGPWFPRYWSRNPIAVGDSTVVVYDGERAEIFTLEGAFEGSVRLGGGHASIAYGVRHLDLLSDDSLLVAVDSIDFERGGRRVYQSWLVTGWGGTGRSDGAGGRPAETVRREVVWARELPPKPTLRLRPRQPRPFWASRDGCLAFSDGRSPYVHRFDLATGRADSVALEPWPVPALGEDPDDGASLSIGGREVGEGDGGFDPIRWVDLAIDPDGLIWIEGWRTRASDEPPIVLVVDPVRGETFRVPVPGFPRAFGEPGVIYVAEEHPGTEEHVLVRYELGREEM